MFKKDCIYDEDSDILYIFKFDCEIFLLCNLNIDYLYHLLYEKFPAQM